MRRRGDRTLSLPVAPGFRARRRQRRNLLASARLRAAERLSEGRPDGQYRPLGLDCCPGFADPRAWDVTAF